jgi:hypothetical protein
VPAWIHQRPFTSSQVSTENGKAQAPGRTDRMPSHLCIAHYGPGLMGYQTGARIVRQAQEQAGPEYIRPGTASSKLAVTPAAVEVHIRCPLG